MGKVRVTLVRKLAEIIDGVDLSGRAVGDSFHVAAEHARLLLAEEWAVPAERKSKRKAITVSGPADGLQRSPNRVPILRENSSA